MYYATRRRCFNTEVVGSDSRPSEFAHFAPRTYHNTLSRFTKSSPSSFNHASFTVCFTDEETSGDLGALRGAVHTASMRPRPLQRHKIATPNVLPQMKQSDRELHRMPFREISPYKRASQHEGLRILRTVQDGVYHPEERVIVTAHSVQIGCRKSDVSPILL
jgi:hypothetical protein